MDWLTNFQGYDAYLGFSFARDSGKVEPQLVTSDIFPKRREHSRMLDSFVPLEMQSPGALGSSSMRGTLGSVASHSDSNLRPARIRAEIQDILANPHPYYDAYMSDSDMSFWKVVIQGPPESAYSTGT